MAGFRTTPVETVLADFPHTACGRALVPAVLGSLRVPDRAAQAAMLLGAGFLYFAFRLFRLTSARASSDLFRYSIVYLALLFGAIAVDALVAA